MYFDAHVHSVASPDSEMNAKDAIATLATKGLGVIFTEHVDYVLSSERDLNATDFFVNGKQEFVYDFEIYPATYQSLRSDSVLLGLEIGLTAAYATKNKKTCMGDYDYILGSIHSVDGMDIYFDLQNGIDKHFISRYLTYSREMVELCGFFDTLGHIDYVIRYDANARKWYRYEYFAQEFDALFKALIERDIALEMNTALFDKIDDYEKILTPIYSRFRKLGGKYCTIGSDAHCIQDLGRHFDKAKNVAVAAGLEVVYYRRRKCFLCE